jgi:hypothetical protein
MSLHLNVEVCPDIISVIEAIKIVKMVFIVSNFMTFRLKRMELASVLFFDKVKYFILHLGQEKCSLTARQLREFALPGAIHRLIVPVASMELSRWAAGYGAIFAITVRVGFITIAVQRDSC